MRCKRCRTYINPFVSWLGNGRQWRCNVCGMVNDVPTSYFCHLDQSGARTDKAQRPELSQASVELVREGGGESLRKSWPFWSERLSRQV